MAINETVNLTINVENADQTGVILDAQGNAIVRIKKEAPQAGQAVSSAFRKANRNVQPVAGSLDAIEKELADLRKSFRSAFDPATRREIAAQIVSLERQRKEMIDLTRQTDQFGNVNKRANLLLIDLSRGAQDAAFGFRAIVNNVEPVITGIVNLSRQAEVAGTTLRQAIVGALTGPTGILIAFSLISTALIVFDDEISRVFASAGDSIDSFRGEIDDLIDEIVEIEEIEFAPFRIPEEEINRTLPVFQRRAAEIRNIFQEAAEARRAFIPNEDELRAELTFVDAEIAKLQEAQFRRNILNRAEEFALEQNLQRTLTEEEKDDIEELEDAVTDALDRQTREEIKAIKRREREAKAAARRIATLRERLERQLRDQEIKTIQDTQEREIATINERFDRLRALAIEAGRSGELTRIEEARQAALERLEKERLEEIAKFEIDLARDVAREEAQVQRIVDRETTNRFKELEQEKLDAVRTTASNFASAWDDAARQAADSLQNVERAVSRVTEDFLVSIREELQRQREFTTLDIELQREAFAREERELRLSLRNREIAVREFNLELRRITQERAEFEKEVERDKTTFTIRLFRSFVDSVIREVERLVANIIARKIALAAINLITGGASAGFGQTVGQAGIIGAGFAEGGYTGNKPASAVAGVVHGGEFVHPADVVRGDPRPFYAFSEAVRRRRVSPQALYNLSGIVGRRIAFGSQFGFQEGGFVPSQVFAAPGTVGTSDLGGIVASQEALRQEFRRLALVMQEVSQRPVQVNVGRRASREITQESDRQRRRVRPFRSGT